jgi:hypothetical protein
MKLKGQRFETDFNIQKELQVVINNIEENDFHGAFEVSKKPMGLLCMS